MNYLLATFAIVLTIIGTLPAGAASEPDTLSAEQALQRLLEGNARYVHNKPLHPNSRPSAAPQHPMAVVLSCSDSRVPPEIIFDQGVGNLFVVRTAGNTYDQLALETIEYAIGHLGTKLILVIGHDQCGAVSAAVKNYPKADVGPMLKNIYPAVAATKDKPGDAVANAVNENAILIAARLAREPALAEAIAAGKLKILPARYRLATGKVEILPAR
ncbi:MAG TPA: carbonic anhydrase [Candidatus Binataceae bacterium]|nr:carbonic anhydrase [Candidatus Binataceae bacterium]